MYVDEEAGDAEEEALDRFGLETARVWFVDADEREREFPGARNLGRGRWKVEP